MPLGTTIAATARAAVGTPFAWGGVDPASGVDHSGLVAGVFAQHGIDLPSQAFNLATVGDEVPADKLQPGDVVFLSADAAGRQSDQVGIYLGRGRFVHAPGPGQAVKVSSLADSYYMQRFTGARRMPGVQTAYPQGV